LPDMSLAIIAALYAVLSAPSGMFAPGRNAASVLQTASVELPHHEPSQSRTPSETTTPSTAETQQTQKSNQEAIPQATPSASQPTSENSSTAQQPPASSTPQAQPPAHKKPAAKRTQSKSAPKRKVTSAKKPAPKNGSPDDAPPKVVIHNGGATDPEIEFSPSLSKQQTDAKLENTNKLLDATEENLKKISTKQLNSTQQDMVKQIKTYMQQAKSAAADGDVQQASNLATKARMLSDELAK